MLGNCCTVFDIPVVFISEQVDKGIQCNSPLTSVSKFVQFSNDICSLFADSVLRELREICYN